MRLKSRSGATVIIDKKRVLSQELHAVGAETYYRVTLTSRQYVELSTPIPDVPVTVVERKKLEQPIAQAVEYTERKLPRAEDCPSAGLSMVAGTNVDYHAHEKVKGETFYTHKTAPGLNIVSPSGKLIYETKMDDMYKRR